MIDTGQQWQSIQMAAQGIDENLLCYIGSSKAPCRSGERVYTPVPNVRLLERRRRSPRPPPRSIFMVKRATVSHGPLSVDAGCFDWRNVNSGKVVNDGQRWVREETCWTSTELGPFIGQLRAGTNGRSRSCMKCGVGPNSTKTPTVQLALQCGYHDDQRGTGVQQQWTATTDEILHTACKHLQCPSFPKPAKLTTRRTPQSNNASYPRSSPSSPPVHLAAATSYLSHHS